MKLFEEFTEKQRKDLINNKLTYINKFEDFNRKTTLNDIENEIRSYDFKKFHLNIKGINIEVIPDSKFRELLFNFNNSYDYLTFWLSVNIDELNEINITFDLKELKLNGLGIGYKI